MLCFMIMPLYKNLSLNRISCSAEEGIVGKAYIGTSANVAAVKLTVEFQATVFSIIALKYFVVHKKGGTATAILHCYRYNIASFSRNVSRAVYDCVLTKLLCALVAVTFLAIQHDFLIC